MSKIYQELVYLQELKMSDGGSAWTDEYQRRKMKKGNVAYYVP